MTVTPLDPMQSRMKRAFDLFVSIPALLTVGWLVPVLAWLARRDTGESGIFSQERVGQHGQLFRIYKIRTMRSVEGVTTTATASGDIRITRLGSQLRRFKLDELPQLWNVVRGDMSLVGPRPDVLGYYDRLDPPWEVLLTLRPGVTSPTALRYRNEEDLLDEADDPDWYNDNVLFPAKVEENMQYLDSWSLWQDVRCLAATVVSSVAPQSRP